MIILAIKGALIDRALCFHLNFQLAVSIAGVAQLIERCLAKA